MANQKDLSLTTKETFNLLINDIDCGYFTPDTLEINGELLTDVLGVRPNRTGRR